MATGGGNSAVLYLNGKYIIVATTWGAKTYRPSQVSKLWYLEEFEPLPSLKTHGGSYDGTGIAMQFANENSKNWAYIGEVVANGFWVSNDNICKWKRVS